MSPAGITAWAVAATAAAVALLAWVFVLRYLIDQFWRLK